MLIDLGDKLSFRLLQFFHFKCFPWKLAKLRRLLNLKLFEFINDVHDRVEILTHADSVYRIVYLLFLFYLGFCE